MNGAGKWLLPHVIMALALPITAAVIVAGGLVGMVTGGGPPAPQLTAYALLGGYFVVSMAAFYGYYRDWQALDAAGSRWVPNVWLWYGAHIVLTPFVTAPLYLLRRRQMVGLPWGLGDLRRGQSARGA